jgi:integrase
MEMARNPGLVRRGTKYYLRVSVPVDLIKTLARKEVWKSLRTGDYGKAVKRYRSARVELDQWFDQQRQRRDAGQRLNGQAPRMVSDWLRQADRSTADADFALVGDLLRAALGETDQELAELIEGAADEEATAAVDQVLIANGWPARAHRVGEIWTRRTKVANTTDAAPPEALHGLVRRALVELARRRRDRLQGRPPGAYDVAFNGAAPPVQAGAQPAGQKDAGLTLGELIEKFEADRTPQIGFSKIVEYQATFRTIKETWGEHTVAREIGREHCRQVRDLFKSLPPNASKRWPKLTLAQAAERARENGLATLSATTVNAYMTRLGTLMRWGVREEYLDRNPAEALQLAGTMDPRDAKLPFSTEQLRRIFSAPLYTGCKDDQNGYNRPGPNVIRRGRFWVPLLALFGGLRMGEACQLATGDVTTQDGVPVILVRPDPEAGRRLKTKAARRVVPVHPELIRCGFLAFVETVRQAGHDRLFPELKRDRRGYCTAGFQKWFDRFLDRAGASAPRTSFHSTRHCFRDALREAQVSRDAVLALGGWKAGGTEEIYGGGLRPSTLAREIAKVRYEGLDLSHLHIR